MLAVSYTAVYVAYIIQLYAVVSDTASFMTLGQWHKDGGWSQFIDYSFLSLIITLHYIVDWHSILSHSTDSAQFDTLTSVNS